MMTQAKHTRRKRQSSSSSSSSGSGSSVHSENENPHAKKPKRATTSNKDDLAEHVEDLLNTPEANTSGNVVINTVQDEVLNEISQELDCGELCSPLLLDQLATVVKKMLRTKLSEDKLKEKQRLYTRPQNCETLVTTRVNAEILAKLQSHTRSVDIRLQKVQALLLKGLVPVLQIANTQLSCEAKDKNQRR